VIKSDLKKKLFRKKVTGKISGEEVINIGTPQGSRLSPLLFIILMADLD
jgi:hypothetical protein